jgi:hypothetical protein
LSNANLALFDVDLTSVDGHEFLTDDLGTECSDDDLKDFDVMLFDMLKFSVKLIFVNDLKSLNELFEVDLLDNFDFFLL